MTTNDHKTGRTRNALTLTQRMKVLDFLRTVCRKEGDFAVYDRDWSDADVADRMSDELNEKITSANVQGIRREMIGNLKSSTFVSADLVPDVSGLLTTLTQTRDDLAALTDLVNDLNKRVTEIEAQVERLKRPANVATMTAIDKAIGAVNATKGFGR